jgi:hypothetical protein
MELELLRALIFDCQHLFLAKFLRRLPHVRTLRQNALRVVSKEPTLTIRVVFPVSSLPYQKFLPA